MERMVNYSIIIPHKNTPELLQRCLNSIPRREDVQIIIVDDNSDSDKVDFGQFPGLNDPLVEIVFSKEGKGAGYARNVGLAKATGKWLLFADADDFFNHCIHDALDEYMDSDADMIFFKHNCVDSDTYTSRYRGTKFITFIDYWQRSPQKAGLLLRYKHIAVWARLIKRELVSKNNIVFDEVSLADDVTFAYLTGFHASRIHVDPRALYCTTIRKGSISHGKRSTKMILDDLYVVCKRYRFLRENRIRVSSDTSRVKSVVHFYFHDREHFDKAVKILLDLGFSRGGIVKLFIHNFLVNNPREMIIRLFYYPRRMAIKFFPDDGFLSVLHLMLKRQKG